MKRMRAFGAAIVVCATVAGCYGPFNLTKNLHKWNGQLSQNRWVVEGVFLGLTVLPVYEFSALGDAIIFNSVQFWTGKNPIQLTTKSLEHGSEQIVMKYDRDSGRLRLDRFNGGRHEKTLIFEPTSEGMVARGEDGVLMIARREGESVVILDATGAEVSRRSVKEIEGKF